MTIGAIDAGIECTTKKIAPLLSGAIFIKITNKYAFGLLSYSFSRL
jgi:hypothetical protein